MEMTPDNWNKVKALFSAALEQEPSRQAAFLRQACPDDDLRQEVEKLLRNHEQAGDFLRDPVVAPDPLVGRRLGAYKLLRLIGSGGMAGVYLGERADQEYRKQVAIKIVRPGPDTAELLSRFRAERQTLAALDHPNIVKLLDGGSTDEGLPYLVMDYVPGIPIDQYCDACKLSTEQRLRLFLAVSAAVDHAHQKLVIHRDLKPTNILVTSDGVPKLLDFGIAKVLSPDTRSVLTQTGMRRLTPAYASPEQVRGQPVTPASDVYSLGVILYELLTGHQPYKLKQPTPGELEQAICGEEPETPSLSVGRVETETASDGTTVAKTPERVSQTREGQPEKLRRRLRGDLDNILLKALQKEPGRRYGSVEELAQDIDRHLNHLPITARPPSLAYRASKFVQRHKAEVSTGVLATVVLSAAAALFTLNAFRVRDRLPPSAPIPRIQSLAVLPLVNLSGDPAQEYFSDGMTDALITDLSQISSVKVISRTSVMHYKKTDKTLPEIARELNVDGIVEGTVQRSGDRARISAQLIHAASDKHLWANSYDRDMSDVFALERDLAQEIVRQIQARLTSENQAPPVRPRRLDPKALDAYLQGNYHLHRFSRGSGDEEKRNASEYFQRAIDADPNFAPAYNGLAKAHSKLLWPSRKDAAIVTNAAERAVALDPNSSDAHKILGDIKLKAWNWLGAEEEFRRAVALNPNSADARGGLGYLFEVTGRVDDGWKEQQIALELDPNNADLFDERLSSGLDLRGEYDRAIAMFQMFLKSYPEDGGLHFNLARHYMKRGMYKEAQPHLEQFCTLYGFPDESVEMRRAFATSGYRGAIQELAKAAEHLVATHQVFAPITIAQLYATVGDKERAFYWLEQAYARHDLAIAGVDLELASLNTEPLLEPLRSDPRYKDLLRRIGLPP
jgi:eukaryotic-like serine/threonine-protein kinase